MYLKGIEVYGFKSFANKTAFKFHDGITAIVGPNGSGKSNVADAVRWVLGEQSAKQLRGSNMQDVIFSGTQMKKPLGFAYVAITFDNTDHKLPIEYNEVTVARRVYRSGESEYMINKNNTRLKDVQELFLDTGIGKEGYSIIGQGQIDRILSGKPEERRELFDEAAGIVKYKKRKNTAEKDLLIERQNLSRVLDILTEIERQIGPLEVQSSVAKEYLKLKEELKILEIGQFLQEYEKINVEIHTNEENLCIVSTDYEQSKNSFDTTKLDYEKLELELGEKSLKIDKHISDKNELKLNIQKLESDIKLYMEQINTISLSDAHYKDRQKAVKSDITEKNEELNGYLTLKKDLDEKLEASDDKQSEISENLVCTRLKMADYNSEIEKCSADIFKYLNESTELKTKIQRILTIDEQNNIKRSEISQKIIKAKLNEEQLSVKLSDENRKNERILSEIKDKNDKVKDISQKINLRQKEIDEKSRELSQKQQELISASVKMDSLKNLTERYEGYGNSIKRIMEQKGVVPGIIGVIADIIKAEKTFETAIETALGGNIQNIVTDNEETAKELIGFLKRNKFGRATFLPLNSILGNKYNNESVLKEKGVLGVASSLVTVDKRYYGIIEYLLGRTYVVDSVGHALELAKKNKYTLRIVTLEGEQLNPGGSLSGGTYRNSSSLLGRRREIEELEKTKERLNQDIDELEKELESLKYLLSALINQLQIEKEELNSKSINQNTLMLSIKQLENELINNQERLIIYQSGLNEIDKQSKDLKSSLDDYNRLLNENISINHEKEQRVEEYSILLNEEKANEAKHNEHLQKHRMEFISLEQNNQYTIENMRRIKSEISRLMDEESQIDKSIINSVNEKEKRKLSIAECQNKIADSNNRLMQYEDDINTLIKEKESLAILNKGFFSKREELSSRMNELDKELFRIQKQMEKLNEQLDIKISYMWDEYALTLSTASEYKTNNLLFAEVNNKNITGLKNSIKALGDVNVNAIEDYKNLSERYVFLKTQHDDLINSEKTLLELITELDKEMRKQFIQKFEQINIQFNKVFKELFGGGQGTLELTEDEDVLEAGIKIIAQPPGKKLQNMMQLSGGEKALTAISLLFAIQNLKPSPFCLLDEIEAALDDANVKRFADYLHKLTKDTQFIIITHRRGTMGAADVLYGITMQEKGVSTLVSVNLIEDELDK